MQARYHITGAGLVGCVLMQAMEQEGIPFTWSDNASPFVAWKASTGSNLPDVKDTPDLKIAWHKFSLNYPTFIEIAPCFKFSNKIGNYVNVGKGYHMDVPRFVREVRSYHMEKSRLSCNPKQIELRTAGALTCKAWWWGWSTLATATCIRASFVRRVVRQSRYVYPKPGTSLFYVGSTILHQKKAALKTDEQLKHHIEWWWKDWTDFVHRYQVRLVTEPAIQGWRPVGEPGRWNILADNSIEIAPMSASGVKFSPLVAEQIVQYIKQKGY
jgi:hypothetical protein